MFEDQYPLGIHLLPPDVRSGAPVFMDEESSPSEDGADFDELTRTFLVREAVETAREAVAANFVVGSQLAGANMWMVRGTGRCVGMHLFLLDITYRGRLGLIRYARGTGAVTMQNSASSVIITAPSGVPGFVYPAGAVSMQSNEGALTVTTSYVSLTAPDTSEVSNSVGVLPAGYPALPPTPVNKWATIADPIYVAPAGWVLESRDSKDIRNAAGNAVCWAVIDTHTYYHPKRPGGS